MIGVFSSIIHEGVSWDKSAATISKEVHRNLSMSDKPRIETRPVRFGWNEGGHEKASTLVAVYAVVDYIAEVKGICMRLAFENTVEAGLGLLGSQFHTMDNLRRTRNTRNVILSTHKSFVAKHSICTISADTTGIDERTMPDLCKRILTTTFQSANNIQSKRDLMYAFIKHEQSAEFTNVSTYKYHSGDEGFKFTIL